MPLIRSPNTLRTGRMRPAAPRCRSGASSLLRLSPPADRRLPTAAELGDWASRAAGAMMTVTGLHLEPGAGAAGMHGGAAK